jgi:hypothetical protein
VNDVGTCCGGELEACIGGDLSLRG